MVQKPVKVYASPYKSDEGAQAREEVAQALLLAPDVATILKNQRRAFEAIGAATEKLLEGATEISRKQLALHSTLMHQAFHSSLGFWKSDGIRDATTDEKLEAGAETTFEAMRDIASTAIKCNLDALSAFSDRIRRMEPPRATERSHPAQAAD